MNRTQDEIVAKAKGIIAEEQFLDFRHEVLIDALDFEHAKEFLKEDATEEQWNKQRTMDVEKEAREYLIFAYGKAEDHRGISAERSVQKLEMFAWLLGRDDVVKAMTDAPYPNYGVPQLYAFAKGMGWPLPTEEQGKKELDRMAEGKKCRDNCEGGCGR